MIYASSDLREEHEGVLSGLSILEAMAQAKETDVTDALEIAEKTPCLKRQGVVMGK